MRRGRGAAHSPHRHCEELAIKLQSNFALKRRSNPFFHASGSMDCFASLAMTDEKRPGSLPAFRVSRMTWAGTPYFKPYFRSYFKSYLASARLGGVAGHDLISVS